MVLTLVVRMLQYAITQAEESELELNAANEALSQLEASGTLNGEEWDAAKARVVVAEAANEKERAEAVEAAADFQREEREAVEARAASEKAQEKRRIKAEKAAKKAQAAKLALEEAEARKAVKSNTTPRKDKAPKANDPCPCGSGKKYKKCCANKKR